ncbi:MAG TPA: hypothetical protein VGC35_01995 [Allosphingosinicella sp.]|jgi:Ca2+-binding RTX toxin-like protein
MTITITADDSTATNSVVVSGAPAVRISGKRVSFTNAAGGTISSTSATFAAVELEGAGGTIVNQADAWISGLYESNLAIRGSTGADTVVNAGRISGLVQLGEGDDSFIENTDRYFYQVDLGAGDDLFESRASGMFLNSTDGGAGFDRLVLSGEGRQIHGTYLKGFERLDVGNGLSAGGTLYGWNLVEFSGLQAVTLAPAGSYNFVYSVNPLADIFISGGSFTAGPGSSFRDISGSASSEAVYVNSGSVANVSLGGGDDYFFLQRYSLPQPTPTVSGTVNGGAGKDMVLLEIVGGVTVDLANFFGFETVDGGNWSGSASDVRVVNANDYLFIYPDSGGKLTLAQSLSPLAEVRAGYRTTFVLESDATVGRIGTYNEWTASTREAQQDDISSYVVAGTVLGAVHLSTGHDTFDSRLGSIGGAVYGYAGDDVLKTGAGAQSVYGGYGNDTLEAGAGDDLLDGGEGNDTITVTAGVDTAHGGNGTDTLIVDYSGAGQAEFRMTLSARLTGGGYDGAIYDSLDNSPRVNFTSIERFVVTTGSWDDTVTGGEGDDVLTGGGGLDVLVGGAGADRLDGGEGDDNLFSHSADPAYIGYFQPGISYDRLAERDILIGGAGNDSLFAGYGDDVDGGANDAYGDKLFISFRGAAAGVTADFRLLASQSSISVGGGTIKGVEEVSYIEGSEFDDFLAGWAGAAYPAGNSIYGRGGNDHIIAGYYAGWGGPGIFGGDGNDTIDLSAAAYSPNAFGEAGDDIIVGGASYERLEGGEGNDRLEGHYGFDTLLGGAGNDLIDGGSFGDLLQGEDGDDILYGAGDADTLEGGAGRDTLYGDQSLFGTGNAISPSSNADVLKGGEGNDILYGDWGDDQLFGQAGTDTLDGGAGNDLLDGGVDGDVMTGGAGDDTYLIDSSGDAVTELAGEGTDEIRTALGSRSDFAAMYTLAANVENLAGTSATGQGVYGNALDNVILMGTGDDLVVLDGGGSDLVSGGGGDDFLYWGAAFTNADKADGGLGFDTVGLLGSYALSFDADDLVSIEKLAVYSSGNAAAPNGYSLTMHDGNVAAGQKMMVVAQSLLANEAFTFNGAAETGGSFNVRGGSGADTITGGGGADTLHGGLGADTLRGGAGNDVFEYRSTAESKSAGADVIMDFAKGDKINLIPIDADGNAANGDTQFTWLGAGAFSGHAGELRVSQHPQYGQTWVVEADTNGDRQADLTIYMVAPAGFLPEKSDFYV